MKIESIKKSGKKYKIQFENKTKINTYDDVILNNGLLFNKEIDEDLLNKLNVESNYYDIYYKTLNYITRKLRSEKEINEYIDKLKVNENDKKNIIKKLKEIGFIDDKKFTKAYISDRINLSNDGPYKIKKELLNHNIDEEFIDENLSKIDNEMIIDKISKLISKKIKNSKYTGFILKQKTVEYLVNLGFDRGIVSSIYDEFDINNDELLKKEYEKIYKKLSIKYRGKELENKVKNKLFKKGFTIEEINRV